MLWFPLCFSTKECLREQAVLGERKERKVGARAKDKTKPPLARGPHTTIFSFFFLFFSLLQNQLKTQIQNMHVVVGVVGRSLGSFVGGQVVQILVASHGAEIFLLS